MAGAEGLSQTLLRGLPVLAGAAGLPLILTEPEGLLQGLLRPEGLQGWARPEGLQLVLLGGLLLLSWGLRAGLAAFSEGGGTGLLRRGSWTGCGELLGLFSTGRLLGLGACLLGGLREGLGLYSPFSEGPSGALLPPLCGGLRAGLLVVLALWGLLGLGLVFSLPGGLRAGLFSLWWGLGTGLPLGLFLCLPGALTAGLLGLLGTEQGLLAGLSGHRAGVLSPWSGGL